MAYENDHGLIVDTSTDPPTCCGYIMKFPGHGNFSPDGKVDFTDEEVDRHNELLAQAEWEAMLKHGRGMLYVSREQYGETRLPGQDKPTPTYRWYISQWNGSNRRSVAPPSYSFHNFAGKDGRRDFGFVLDGNWWHGVNIGDTQVLRVKRTKKTA